MVTLLQKATKKEQGSQRRAALPRTERMEAWARKCAYKVWNDQEGFPEKLREEGPSRFRFS